MILYASLIVKHVIQIEIGVIKHVNVNVNVIAHAKKITVGILAHAFVRIVSIEKVFVILQ